MHILLQSELLMVKFDRKEDVWLEVCLFLGAYHLSVGLPQWRRSAGGQL